MYECIHTHTPHVHTPPHIHIPYVYTYTHMHMYIHVNAHTQACTCTHTHMWTYTLKYPDPTGERTHSICLSELGLFHLTHWSPVLPVFFFFLWMTEFHSFRAESCFPVGRLSVLLSLTVWIFTSYSQRVRPHSSQPGCLLLADSLCQVRFSEDWFCLSQVIGGVEYFSYEYITMTKLEEF